jgi:UDP:flavonoid glycosyltransferase YjiC (YdhE family)
MIKSDKKPLIGFFPGFFDLGESYPIIKIAKRYKELGGNVLIFSHGGNYEYLAEEQGFEIKRIEPIASGPDIIKNFQNESDENIIRLIKNQALIYKNTQIDALVQTSSYIDCLITPLYANIPLISILSGILSPIYIKANYATYPDNFENNFTRLLPKFIKNRINKWYTLNHTGPITKKINKIAKKLNINIKFRRFHDLILGDYTIFCDDIKFLGIKPTKEFPEKNFVGPIVPDELFKINNKKDEKIEKHLNRQGRSILLTMGSSNVMKGIFIEILKTLNQTDYNVIATYTNLLKEDEIPKLNDNILMKKFIPNINELNKQVDMAIIHGGRGTIYNAAFSGKPAIGIPLNGEQQYNIENLNRHGASLKISKTFFQKEKLLKAISEIFENYDIYLKNAQDLVQKFPKPEGDKNAAYIIQKITSNIK